ncbi:MAG: RNA 2',3'-cyclic phosphodiesterase [Chloroflexota bacterium]|nr:RNA 2',3'-cyclic phosphodiesterase [Chloroflexia bacterium]MDQ3227112.1 RNA 2',3'-cyclic phosphodiesterase [Chloroflexota bacterium]
MSPRTPRLPKVRPPAPDGVDTPWRLFLAVPLPEEVRLLIGHEISSLRQEGWPVRWVQPETAHLTLQFLGEAARERAELLRLALPEIVAAHKRFELRTAALGVFPHFRRPRVLWLGLHGPIHRLAALQADIGRASLALGFAAGDASYHPHLTLGRVRNDDGEGVRLRDLPGAIKGRFVDRGSGAAIAPPATPVPVREVVLFRSHLGKDGARHEPIASFPLAVSASHDASATAP